MTRWLLAKLRERINASYMRRRGFDAGIDDRISDYDVVLFFLPKLAARLRATTRRLPQAFVDRDVVILNRSRLTVGRGVSIGLGVLIDALAENGVVLSDATTFDANAILRGSGGDQLPEQAGRLHSTCSLTNHSRNANSPGVVVSNVRTSRRVFHLAPPCTRTVYHRRSPMQTLVRDIGRLCCRL